MMSACNLILLATYDELGPDRGLEQPLFVILPELALVTLSVLCWDGGCLKVRMPFVCFDQGTAQASGSRLFKLLVDPFQASQSALVHIVHEFLAREVGREKYIAVKREQILVRANLSFRLAAKAEATV